MGIFDSQAGVFTTYRARVQFRDKLMGGTPMDSKLIEAWLRSKAGIQDTEEIRQATLRTLMELGVEVRPDMTFAEMEKASEALAATKQTVGFKRNGVGLYIESRTVKAMLKESTNILFAGAEKWGPSRKGPKAFLAERIFVDPDVIPLGTNEASGVHLFIGHVSGPKGQYSTLTYYEFVAAPAIEFEVMSANDAINADQWAKIWVHAQENGLGALRSQGFGRFDVEAWERVA